MKPHWETTFSRKQPLAGALKKDKKYFRGRGRARTGFRSGGGGDSFQSYPGAQSINADGFTFQDNDSTPVGWGTDQDQDGNGVPQNNYDPVGDPKTLFVARSGFTASGAATTVVDEVTVMSRFRQAYSNDNLWVAASGGEVKSTLSQSIRSTDQVYGSDGVLGLTNNSTKAYPQPGCVWGHADLQISREGSLTVKLFVSHLFARNGSPVACVEFRATDGVDTVSSGKISSMTATTHASGLQVPYYEFTFADLTGLAAGECTVDADIYPWCGPKYTLSSDGDGARSIAPCAHTFMNDHDGSYGQAHAMVATDGNDGTGVVYATQALCEAGYVSAAGNAFLTIDAAIDAVRAYNNANHSRDEAAGGNVWLQDGTFDKEAWDTTVGDFPLTIARAASSTNRSAVLIDAGFDTQTCPRKLKFEDLTLVMSGSGTRRAFNGLASAANAAEDRVFILKDVTFSLTGTTYDPWIWQWHRVFFEDCLGADCRAAAHGTNSPKAVISIGCNESCWNEGGRIFSAIGVKALGRTSAFKEHTNNTGESWPAGPKVFAYNFLSGSASVLFAPNASNSLGFHLPMSVIEQTSTGKCAEIWADAAANPCSGVVVVGLTGVGGRVNVMYNDNGTSPIPMDGAVRLSVAREFNSKDDTYVNAPNAGRWPGGNDWAQYGVDYFGNAAIDGGANSDFFAPGDHWLGEVRPLGTVSGTTSTPLDPDFEDDQSATGGAGADGDYRPNSTGNTDIPLIPAGLAPYPIDMLGQAIPNDGTGFVGALQPAP